MGVKQPELLGEFKNTGLWAYWVTVNLVLNVPLNFSSRVGMGRLCWRLVTPR